jgi:transcriptional regulator with XRE-family HTH domain
MKDQENISPIEQYVIDFIRDLRNDKGLTQDGLASILRVGKSFISNVESLNHRAKYNLNHINILADYYDIRPGDFLPLTAISLEKRKSTITKTAISKSKKAVLQKKGSTNKKK